MRSRASVVILTALACVVAFGGAAFGYFSSTGAGTGTATAGVLGGPTGVAGTQTAGTNAVVVTWTAPSGGRSPTGYYVQRTSTGGGGAQAACGTAVSSPTSNTSCSDTGVAAGTYTYAVIAVFATWTKSSSPSPTVTVLPANQTITYTSTAPSNAVAGGAQYTPAATASSGLAVTFSIDPASSACTLSAGKISFPHAGTCTVDADQAGNANYQAAPQVQQTFSVAKGNQTITFTSAAPTSTAATGGSYTVSASSSGFSGNPVTFSSATSSVCTTSGTNGATVSFVASGTCTINANQVGGADWNAAAQAQQTFTVAPVLQVISDLTMVNSGASTYFYTGDTLTLTFSQRMNPTSVCSSWSGTTGTQSIPVSIALNGRAVTVTTGSCTLHYGSFDLGASYGTSDGFAFAGTLSISNDTTSATITLTVGGLTTSGSNLTSVGSSVPSFTPTTGMRDDAGDQLPATAYVATHASSL